MSEGEDLLLAVFFFSVVSAVMTGLILAQFTSDLLISMAASLLIANLGSFFGWLTAITSLKFCYQYSRAETLLRRFAIATHFGLYLSILAILLGPIWVFAIGSLAEAFQVPFVYGIWFALWLCSFALTIVQLMQKFAAERVSS